MPVKIAAAAIGLLPLVVLCHCSDGGTGSTGNAPDGASPPKGDAAVDAAEAAARVVPPGGKRVFVTSEMFDGNIDGLDGADARCTAAAEAAKLTGTWSAWVAVTARSATSQLPKAGEWYLVDGTFVTDRARLADTSVAKPLDVAIHLDERGANVEESAWTGAGVAGAPAEKNCDNWTANTDFTGGTGSTKAVDVGWTSAATPSCAEKHHLYCFEK